MINFKEEVLKRKEDFIKDLQQLLRIKSELTEYNPNSKDAPFGPGNKEALEWFLALGKKDGFKTLNVDGYAGHVEYGDQKEYVAMIGHLDVVPALEGWKYPPYGAEIHNNRLYARGAEDDKGPTMAGYYALKIIKELNLKLSKRIKCIVGVDEESGFRCMKHYFEKLPQQPVAGFIPDADFPVIHGEKGVTRTLITGKLQDDRILHLSGGSKDNMVSDFASVEVLKNEDFAAKWTLYLSLNSLIGEVIENDNSYTLTIEGKSAHGAVPDEGVSAINLLFKGLIDIGITNNLVDYINKFLIDDNYGVKLGISYNDDVMGKLTNNFGVIKLSNRNFEINLNIRFPRGIDYYKYIIPTIKKTCDKYDFVVEVESYSDVLYYDPNSDMVKTLLNVYQKHTNDFSKPICIGGGTYAKSAKNVVAFGPGFPGKPSFIHQVNESIDLDDMMTAIAIYAESLYELAK